MRIQDLVDQEQVCKDVISLGQLIDGRLRVRLVDFFATSKESKLSVLNKLKLMCEFIKVEEKDERKKATAGTIYSLLNDNMLGFDSYHQALAVLQHLDAQTQERIRKHFYSVSEFKRLHENYKIDISNWSLETFLYYREFIEIFREDANTSRIIDKWRNVVHFAGMVDGQVACKEKTKGTFKDAFQKMQFYKYRYGKLNFPYEIPSEKLKAVIFLLGVLAQEQLSQEKRKYEIGIIQKQGESLLKDYFNTYLVDPEIIQQEILKIFVTDSENRN